MLTCFKGESICHAELVSASAIERKGIRPEMNSECQNRIVNIKFLFAKRF
jgi:hypothetical protein